jgi:hypothetical protein
LSLISRLAVAARCAPTAGCLTLIPPLPSAPTPTLSDELYRALAWVQRRIKYGLPVPAQADFFEAGFADRIVATPLADHFPDVASRRDSRFLATSTR